MKYKILSNIAVSETGFVFQPATGDSFSVNPIGALILDTIRSGKNDIDIKKQVMQEYDVDASSIDKDFYDFVSQLKQFNIIKEDES